MFRPLVRYKFSFIAGLVIIGAAISWLVLRQTGKRDVPEKTVTGEDRVVARIFKARSARFSDYLKTMGTIKGNNEIELRFPVMGYLSKINFKEGEWVEKGEVIAELDSREAGLKVKKARIESENTEKLYNLGAVLKERYDEAKVNLELAEEEQKRYLLVSPFRGILGEIKKDEGELVTPQDNFAGFVEASSLKVEIGIIEKEIRKVTAGQSAEIIVDTYPDRIFRGKVATVVPVVEGTNRTMRVGIGAANPEGELLPGMFARVKILIYEKENAVVVPVSTLFQEEGNYFIFKINGERLQRSNVVVAYLNEEYAEIEAGVREGDAIAIKITGEMQDGKKVEIID